MVGSVNIFSILAAALAAWLAGAVYYGVLGRVWMAALDRSQEEMRRTGVAAALPFVLSFVAEIVMAAVLALATAAFGARGSLTAGLGVAALMWLGFVLTTVAVNNAYPGRKLLLTAIDSLHWLIALAAMAVVFGLFA